jgi:hypothetical protein
MYGGADSFNAVIGSAGGRDVVRSHDRGATWGDASTLSVRPISYATTSDGAVLGVGGGGKEGIWLVRGD